MQGLNLPMWDGVRIGNLSSTKTCSGCPGDRPEQKEAGTRRKIVQSSFLGGLVFSTLIPLQQCNRWFSGLGRKQHWEISEHPSCMTRLTTSNVSMKSLHQAHMHGPLTCKLQIPNLPGTHALTSSSQSLTKGQKSNNQAGHGTTR